MLSLREGLEEKETVIEAKQFFKVLNQDAFLVIKKRLETVPGLLGCRLDTHNNLRLIVVIVLVFNTGTRAILMT